MPMPKREWKEQDFILQIGSHTCYVNMLCDQKQSCYCCINIMYYIQFILMYNSNIAEKNLKLRVTGEIKWDISYR